MTLLFGRADLLEALPSPRLLKSHARWQVLPRTGRFIYITRNVRDVAVSCFHHANQLVGMDHDLEKYLDLFLEQDLWFPDFKSWWTQRHDDNVLWLFFDDVIQDLEGTVRKVADFLDLELDEENIPRILERRHRLHEESADLEGTALRVAEFCQLDVGERLPQIAERCHPDFLERHPEKFDPRLRRLSRSTAEKFIRKGMSGSGRGAFNARQEKLLNKKIRALARQFSDLNDSPGNKLLSLE